MVRLKAEPVSEEELARAKNQIEASFVFQEDSVHSGLLLARFEVIGGFRLKDEFVRDPGGHAEQLRRAATPTFPTAARSRILIPKS